MEKYIGFKLVQAEPVVRSKSAKNVFPLSQPCPDMAEDDREYGYRVVYPDGYQSWSPKDVFEKAYMRVGNNNTITQDNVDKFIIQTDVYTMGEKTTIVKATLANDFVIVESSSCVDPVNYDEELGAKICIDRIRNQVWHLLGFLLQTAKEGMAFAPIGVANSYESRDTENK